MAAARGIGRHRCTTVRVGGVGLILAACGVTIACAGSQGTVTSRQAVALEVAAAIGRPDAEEAVRRVLDNPAGDLEVRCAGWYAMGRIRSRSGDDEEALSWLARVGRQCASLTRISSEALWEVAQIARRRGIDAARPVLEGLVLRFPDQPAAIRAVRELAAGAREPAQVPGTVARLRELYRQTEGREVAPVILWESAELLRRLSDRGSRVEALGLYRMLAERHRASGLLDDALWAAGNLSLELGDPLGALDHFETLRGMREWSFLFGSYENPRYQDALEGMARAHRALGRPQEAALALEVLARERPGEARRWLEQAAQALEEGGDPKGAARLRRRAEASGSGARSRGTGAKRPFQGP